MIVCVPMAMKDPGVKMRETNADLILVSMAQNAMTILDIMNHSFVSINHVKHILRIN